MSIKNIINKKDNGTITRVAIVGTILSPLAIPVLKTIETQMILHSPTVYAFNPSMINASNVGALAVSLVAGVSTAVGLKIFSKALVKGEEKC